MDPSFVSDSHRVTTPSGLQPTTSDAVDALSMQDDFGNLLPPLFNDNIDAFHFHDIFLGDSTTDLDNFFTNIFSLPTFPRLGGEVFLPISATPSQSLGYGYKSDAEV